MLKLAQHIIRHLLPNPAGPAGKVCAQPAIVATACPASFGIGSPAVVNGSYARQRVMPFECETEDRHNLSGP